MSSPMTGIVGRTYLERGEPVTVIVQWAQVPKADLLVLPGLALKATAPRNVLIKRGDGSRVVRPFRGLRKLPPDWCLRDYLCVSPDGEWVPGSIDRAPLFVAVYLEYLRRGGNAEPVGGIVQYRAWLDENAQPAFLTEALRIAGELERLTEAGAQWPAFCELLDPMLPTMESDN